MIMTTPAVKRMPDTTMPDRAIGASFRDPSGFVFEHDGRIYRQVNRSYRDDYDHLMSSGLYKELTSKGLLVAHSEVDPPDGVDSNSNYYKTLLPDRVPFISYPYEWCFSQLKDAALLTLRLQKLALKHDMVLKDASAYNIQFGQSGPVMIDTLSFERYEEGRPWVGYRQFCQHFLAPLALMARRDVRLLDLMRVQLDGVPLDLAVSLLPARTWLNWGLFMHLRMHARYQRSYEAAGQQGANAEATDRKNAGAHGPGVSRKALGNLIEDLRAVVRKLDWTPKGTEWAEYYSGDSYSEDSLAHKQSLIAQYVERLNPACVWDLGANTGVYSRIAATAGARVIAFDVDPACVERNYRMVRKNKEENLLPLRLDLVNPSPSIGWAHDERSSLAERANADMVLALALVHHIAISNNVPLSKIAFYFARLAPHLVIEFVPKSDAKVKTLLATRVDVFPGYTREGFEAAFSEWFETLESSPIRGSDRILYLLKRKKGSPSADTGRSTS